MHAATRTIKTLIAELGIPHRAITARSDLGLTSAAVHDRAHVALVAANAADLVRSWLGVVLWKLPCGCPTRVLVTTDPRHAGRVDELAVDARTEHVCPDA
ncbi:hypothetical protein [Nonomuraea sp. NPDC050310]|uniref:hypothetical protein n=1 Tax=Nonomuraea sp. NPDC050310 TaxID=3154935 RepID=UPI0033D1565F